jgi:DNA-directed RNA polymerase specialized sigma24 family protein
MERQSQGSGTKLPEEEGPQLLARRPRAGHGSDTEWVGALLGAWKGSEIRLAGSFWECRGLTGDALEDIYQDTTEALLRRSHVSEEHLRNALHQGIKWRALNSHRNRGTRGRRFAESAPGMHRIATTRADDESPERKVQRDEDRAIAKEFIAELSKIEKRVFAGLIEGMKYRAIAAAQGIDLNEARNAERAVEQKRERFQRLYETGRLCGYRSATILALKNGEATSEQLEARALAHLESCTHCRTEHKTNATLLRRSFQDQAKALLPGPLIAGHLGWLARLDLRLRGLLQRFMPERAPLGTGTLRERGIGLIAGGGAAAKAAVATLVVVAGIGASSVLQHHSPNHRRHAHSQARYPAPAHSAYSTPPVLRTASATTGHAAPKRHTRAAAKPQHSQPATASSSVREPGGFAYLGVPKPKAESTASHARTATRTAGGPFSP